MPGNDVETTRQEQARQRVLARGETWIDWDERVPDGEVVRYLKEGIVVLERPRCPAINSSDSRGRGRQGMRCQGGLREGFQTCWNHRDRGLSDAE